MQRVVFASSNRGKILEINQIVRGLDIEIVAQSEFEIEGAEETGLTFVENAILKARHAARHSGLPAIADDSGLEVDALDGAPGIYSSRYAGERADDRQNIEKLLADLRDLAEPERRGRFQCVMVYMRHASDPTPIICQGTWEGYILNEPRGSHGFGYDPVFYLPEYRCASAELPPDTKNRISHRGQALRRLLEALQQVRRP